VTGPPESALAPAAAGADTSVMRKPKTFTDEIRRAILDAKKRGLSRYRLAREIGVSEGNLAGFVRGVTGISSAALDRLAPLLGLRLVVDVRRQRRPAKGKPS